MVWASASLQVPPWCRSTCMPQILNPPIFPRRSIRGSCPSLLSRRRRQLLIEHLNANGVCHCERVCRPRISPTIPSISILLTATFLDPIHSLSKLLPLPLSLLSFLTLHINPVSKLSNDIFWNKPHRNKDSTRRVLASSTA